MSDMEQLGSSEPQGISRRTVTKAMAWAVPVIAVASAAPAFAASKCLPQFSLGAGSCKCPGQGQNFKQYNLNICVSNTSGCDNPVPAPATAMYIWDVKNGSGKHLVPQTGSFPVAIPLSNGAGCSGVTQFVWAGGQSSSANFLYFEYNFDPSSNAGATWSAGIDSPPDCPTTQCGQ